jgi:hypothetical protein
MEGFENCQITLIAHSAMQRENLASTQRLAARFLEARERRVDRRAPAHDVFEDTRAG